MITHVFSDFPYIDKPILIPIHAVFYRGIAKGKNIKNLEVLRENMPIYLVSSLVAKYYSTNDNDIFIKIKTKRDLRLIDIRKVISLLPMILNTLPVNDLNTQLIKTLKLSLGITNINEQIDIIKTTDIPQDRIDRMIDFSKNNRWFNLGVRIPITTFDATIVLILKQIFSSYYDGIIAPQLITPFEINGKSHKEVIIFNANKLDIINDDLVNIEEKHILNILDGTKINLLNMPMYIGGSGNMSYFIDKNKQLYDKKWYNKTSKLVEKAFGNISIKPDLWNNSIHYMQRHLEHATWLELNPTNKLLII